LLTEILLQDRENGQVKGRLNLYRPTSRGKVRVRRGEGSDGSGHKKKVQSLDQKKMREKEWENSGVFYKGKTIEIAKKDQERNLLEGRASINLRPKKIQGERRA